MGYIPEKKYAEGGMAKDRLHLTGNRSNIGQNKEKEVICLSMQQHMVEHLPPRHGVQITLQVIFLTIKCRRFQ